MAEENLKVVVRVRPMAAREKRAKCIVAMEGNQTLISNPNFRGLSTSSSSSSSSSSLDARRSFTFDQSFWSHDGFRVDERGTLVPDMAHKNGSKYVDQKRLCREIGEAVIGNAWAGYNATLFAYGQTGAGKSYSIVGDENKKNPGVAPWICAKLFKGIDAMAVGPDAGEFSVTFNMLEIYSERVRDLVNGAVELVVREDPVKGFYAVNQSNVGVDSYEDIEEQMNSGFRQRTIACTNMNAASSRGHTIIGIKFHQRYVNAHGDPITRSSIINLVDLAGSERQSLTGAEAERLREGAAINLSLSTLGNVISALVQNRSHVPYRDSALTKLLRNALGGNSKTFMIAAISPADVNYEETLSTLRYADRAKQIKNVAKVNESPTERLVRDLREEVGRLVELLKERETEIETLRGEKEMPREGTTQWRLREMLREMETEEKFLGTSFGGGKRNKPETRSRSVATSPRRFYAEPQQYPPTPRSPAASPGFDFLDKPETARSSITTTTTMATTTPYIWNMSEHPQLNRKIVHYFEKVTTTIGGESTRSATAMDVEIFDEGIEAQQLVAEIVKTEQGLFVRPASSSVAVNGVRLHRRGIEPDSCLSCAADLLHPLRDKDWILFGRVSVWGVADPRRPNGRRPTPTLSSANTEMNRIRKSSFCSIL